MQAVEFTVELNDKLIVAIPQDVAAQLPPSGTARVIILTEVTTRRSNGDWAPTSNSPSQEG